MGVSRRIGRTPILGASLDHRHNDVRDTLKLSKDFE
jgi:hypothetical protein